MSGPTVMGGGTMFNTHGNGIPHAALKIIMKDGKITLAATECSITFTVEQWNQLLLVIGEMRS